MIAVFALFFAFIAGVNRYPESNFVWFANAIGWAYGLPLYISGSLAVYFALAPTGDARFLTKLVCRLPVTLVPALIGLFGTVHGYMAVFDAIALEDAATTSMIYSAYSAMLATLFVGLLFSIPAFVTLALRMIALSLMSPLNHADNG